MKSRIFYSNAYKRIEQAIITLLNGQPEFLSSRTASSPRAAGDAIQAILADEFQTILGKLSSEYSAEFARRAMADLAFTDPSGFYYVVDVKTHRTETHFNMPNLTSVERLARFYQDDKNYFVVLIVQYTVSANKVLVEHVHFIPIEFLSWECLTLGALGWGQIQISNASRIRIRERYSRKKWMLELCDLLLDFYPREIGKISKRIDYFAAVKTYWENRPDL